MHHFSILLKVFLLIITLSACTPSTGIDISQNPLDLESYQKERSLYIYRPACTAGSLAKIILEVNNINVGILGTGEILVSKITSETSNIVAFGDLNQKNYSLNLRTVSDESRYLLASYCDKLIGLKIVEKPFDEWLQIIKQE